MVFTFDFIELSPPRYRYTNKRGGVQDLELALDSEHRAAEDARQAASLLERKRIALQTELDDVRALLDAVSVTEAQS